MAGSIAYDPYFLQAYATPYPSFYGYPQQAGNVTQMSAAPAATNDSTKSTKTNVIENGSTEESSGSGKALAVVGTVAAIGAAVLCRKAYTKGVGCGTVDKIKNGFSQMFNSAKNKLPKAKEKFSVTEINGQQVCTLPGRQNMMRTNVPEGLSKIGSSAEIPELTKVVDGKTVLNEGIALRDGTYIRQNGSKLRFRKGKVVEYTSKDGENLLTKYRNPIEEVDKQDRKTVNNILAVFQRGEFNKLTGEVSNLKFSHTENGTSRLFTMSKPGETPKLQCAVSKNFDMTSDAVGAYRIDNKKADTALKALEEGKKDAWKIAEADYVSPTFGTFHIKNGEIKGLTQNGTYYAKDSDRFKVLYNANKDAFDNVLKNEESFTNIRRVLA